MTDNKRTYKVGSRRTDLPGMKNKERDGLMSESRWAWVRNVIGQYVILVDETENDPQDRTIRLYHPIPSRPPVSWNLTALTEAELVKLKQLFDLAFEWALPIVQRRDRKAQDAFDNGDDSHSRIYRDVQHLVVRKRPLGEHGQGVSQRLDGIPGNGNFGAVTPPGPVRGDSSEVPEYDTQGGEPEDDGPTPDSVP